MTHPCWLPVSGLRRLWVGILGKHVSQPAAQTAPATGSARPPQTCGKAFLLRVPQDCSGLAPSEQLPTRCCLLITALPTLPAHPAAEPSPSRPTAAAWGTLLLQPSPIIPLQAYSSRKSRRGRAAASPPSPAYPAATPLIRNYPQIRSYRAPTPKAALFAFHPSHQVSFSCWLDAGGWRRGASCPAVPVILWGAGIMLPRSKRSSGRGCRASPLPGGFSLMGFRTAAPLEKFIPFGTTILRCAAGSCCQWPGAAGSLHTVPYPPPDGALSAALRP